MQRVRAEEMLGNSAEKAYHYHCNICVNAFRTYIYVYVCMCLGIYIIRYMHKYIPNPEATKAFCKA